MEHAVEDISKPSCIYIHLCGFKYILIFVSCWGEINSQRHLDYIIKKNHTVNILSNTQEYIFKLNKLHEADYSSCDISLHVDEKKYNCFFCSSEIPYTGNLSDSSLLLLHKAGLLYNNYCQEIDQYSTFVPGKLL